MLDEKRMRRRWKVHIYTLYTLYTPYTLYAIHTIYTVHIILLLLGGKSTKDRVEELCAKAVVDRVEIERRERSEIVAMNSVVKEVGGDAHKDEVERVNLLQVQDKLHNTYTIYIYDTVVFPTHYHMIHDIVCDMIYTLYAI